MSPFLLYLFDFDISQLNYPKIYRNILKCPNIVSLKKIWWILKISDSIKDLLGYPFLSNPLYFVWASIYFVSYRLAIMLGIFEIVGLIQIPFEDNQQIAILNSVFRLIYDILRCARGTKSKILVIYLVKFSLNVEYLFWWRYSW